MCFHQEMSASRYQIEMWESTPYVEFFFQATVPISCSGCSATVQLKRHIGLTVSNCSVTFAASDPPLTNHSLQVRAVQTAGSNSRIVELEFAAVVSDDVSWQGYRPPSISVSSRRRSQVSCFHRRLVCSYTVSTCNQLLRRTVWQTAVIKMNSQILPTNK